MVTKRNVSSVKIEMDFEELRKGAIACDDSRQHEETVEQTNWRVGNGSLDSDDSDKPVRIDRRKTRPRMSKAEKRKRNREACRKYRGTKKGKAAVSKAMRKRYRSIKEAEAADTVDNMLAKARSDAYRLGW